MILYPAIDLKGGQCVRLLRGEMAAATVYNDDPATQARAFAAAGCRWIHVVDLDGAFAGRSVNGDAVRAILGAADRPVQLGGGLRDRVAIDAWLEAGVARVILGTVALRDPELVIAACRAHPGRIGVGIDARGGKVAVEGWAETAEITAADLALKFEDAGVAILRFYSGAIGSVSFTINSFGRNMEGSLTLFCEKGTIKIGGQYLNEIEYENIAGMDPAELKQGRPPNEYGAYQGSMSNHEDVYQNIQQVLTAEGSIGTIGFEGLKTVEIIDKIYRAAKIVP